MPPVAPVIKACANGPAMRLSAGVHDHLACGRIDRDLVAGADRPCDVDFEAVDQGEVSMRRTLRHDRIGEVQQQGRSEEHTSELKSLMRISYAVFCLKKKKTYTYRHHM